MPFTKTALELIAHSASLNRGRSYANTGRVHHLDIKPDSASGFVSISGVVRGSRQYRTSLLVDPAANRVVETTCTCPYDWNDACKHIVAVGLVAVDNWPATTTEPNQNGQLESIIQKFAAANQLNVSDKALKDLIGKILQTNQSLAQTGSQIKPPTFKKDRFTSIEIALAYHAESDHLNIKATAVYGPRKIPLRSDQALEREETLPDGQRIIYRLQRDWAAENLCAAHLHLSDYMAMDADGLWLTQEAEIYDFLSNTLPELRLHYHVEIDPSALALIDIKKHSVTSEWKVEGSGIDFFKLDVAWQCGKTTLGLKQLQRMARTGVPFVRQPDGSFIAVKNVKQVAESLRFLHERCTLDGNAFQARLFRIPELRNLLEHKKGVTFAAAHPEIKSLLEETQEGKPIQEASLPSPLHRVLRPYQKRGVAWGQFLQKYHFGGILADDMGLGKTLQALSLLLIEHKKAVSKTKPSIVVCPKTLIHTWKTEAATFAPTLKVLALEGSVLERKALRKHIKDYDLLITSYPLLLRDLPEYLKKRLEFHYCVLDEAQYIKQPASASAQAVKLLPAQHRLALSGTPLENGVHELWSIFDFLMPGFLGDQKKFREEFQRPIQEEHDTEALARLQTNIRPFVLRRTKQSELKDLPPKIEQTRSCQLTPEQLVLYTQTLSLVRDDVFKTVDKKGFKHAQIEILAALTRLRQVCNHPALVAKHLKPEPLLSGKMPALLEIVDEAIEGRHKVLIFSAFTRMLDIIRQALDYRHILSCTIEGKTKDRPEQIKRFCDDPNVPVFLLSLKAGGVGLTLTKADTVILVDPWWNPMAEIQAADRAHRIGQTQTVNVYKLITEGTIEERVLELQKRKRQLFDALLEENGELLDKLTWEDVKDLFETSL